MEWKAVARLVAAEVAERHGVPVSPVIEDAVMAGMTAECDMWIRKER